MCCVCIEYVLGSGVYCLRLSLRLTHGREIRKSVTEKEIKDEELCRWPVEVNRNTSNGVSRLGVRRMAFIFLRKWNPVGLQMTKTTTSLKGLQNRAGESCCHLYPPVLSWTWHNQLIWMNVIFFVALVIIGSDSSMTERHNTLYGNRLKGGWDSVIKS